MICGQLISVGPEEIKFEVELEKQSHSCIEITNNTDEFVAFKVQTTSPNKYNVRPNASVLQPRDTAAMIVTLHAQKELPPDLQCNDKFLIQSTRMPNFDFDDIPPDTFNKDDNKVTEEFKLIRIVYVAPPSDKDQELQQLRQKLASTLRIHKLLEQQLDQELQRLRQDNKILLQQVEMLLRMNNCRKKSSSSRRRNGGFSLIFAVYNGCIGLLISILFNYALSSRFAA